MKLLQEFLCNHWWGVEWHWSQQRKIHTVSYKDTVSPLWWWHLLLTSVLDYSDGSHMPLHGIHAASCNKHNNSNSMVSHIELVLTQPTSYHFKWLKRLSKQAHLQDNPVPLCSQCRSGFKMEDTRVVARWCTATVKTSCTLKSRQGEILSILVNLNPFPNLIIITCYVNSPKMPLKFS